MKDLYLKATSYAALISYLTENGIEMTGEYFQNEQFIIDWIGKVPKIIDEETGEVTEWFTQYRFNVRLLDESVTLFDSFTSVHPETPYRIFS